MDITNDMNYESDDDKINGLTEEEVAELFDEQFELMQITSFVSEENFKQEDWVPKRYLQLEDGTLIEV